MLKNIINSVQAPPPNCLECSHSKGFKGFTLAEVLITLTIIGVIAALTIPNLMQSYKKHQVEVGIKEAYSILSNALTMAKAEHGGTIGSILENSYIAGEQNEVKTMQYFTENYLEPYIKYNQKKGYRENSAQNIFTSINYAGGIKNFDGSSSGVGRETPHNWIQYALANGMALGVFYDAWNKAMVFVIDINGGKHHPNQIGYDIFYFSANNDDSKDNSSLTCSAWGYIYYFNYAKCETEGYSCSCPIMKNGWRIPDDYPIKNW